jgi:hypothetical protein
MFVSASFAVSASEIVVEGITNIPWVILLVKKSDCF